MFIRTESYREYINSDDIKTLRSDPKGNAFAVMRDGTIVRMASSDNLERIVALTTPVTPAAPGYEALWTVRYDDDEKLGVIRHPVLGWRVDPYGGMTAVTLDDEHLSTNVSFGGVKYPDGRIVCAADATYENEEAWFKEMQAFETQRRAGKAA